MSMVFALVLLGCADDGTACQRLPTQVEHYVSKTECQAQQETSLTSDAAMRADYPTVITRCQRVSGTAALAPRPGKGAAPAG